ncbi:MAG: MBL fold metallo-hydrolase [Dysgonamonadaceae bacterium]|nr:MBL fold metallo-hydrolase [Dysgonamonadaceae bacterium]
MKIKTFVFNIVSVNTFVLYDDTLEAAIIDCGCFNSLEQTELTRFIKQNNLQVKHLLNTHLHFDHALGNAYASRIFDLTPQGNPLEETKMPPLLQQASRFGIRIGEPPVPLGSHLEDGDIITFGHNALQCRHIPGHSPGSLVFYESKAGCLFSGDVLFKGSIGRTDLWGGNYDALVNGIQIKLFTLPDETVVYPGHGPTTTIGQEKRHNPYFR